MNSFVGHSLVESLRNDHKNDDDPHIIVGTKCDYEVNEIPRGVTKVVDVFL